MKKVIIIILSVIFLNTLSVCYAQTIETGNASAKSKVETNVQGGSVYTKIEVEANGEKKTLETTEPGTHTLEVTSNEASGTEKLEEKKIKPTPSATVTPKIKNKINSGINELNFNSWMNNFKNLFKDFLKNIGF